MSGCVLALPDCVQVQAHAAEDGHVYLYESVDGTERPYLCVRVGLRQEFVCLAADSAWCAIPLDNTEWLRPLGKLRVEGDAL